MLSYLSLQLPHVDEVLAELRGQQVLPAEHREAASAAVPAAIREQTGAAVRVEHGAVPQLGPRIAAQQDLQRSRHHLRTHTSHRRTLYVTSETDTSRPGAVHCGRCRDRLYLETPVFLQKYLTQVKIKLRAREALFIQTF